MSFPGDTQHCFWDRLSLTKLSKSMAGWLVGCLVSTGIRRLHSQRHPDLKCALGIKPKSYVCPSLSELSSQSDLVCKACMDMWQGPSWAPIATVGPLLEWPRLSSNSSLGLRRALLQQDHRIRLRLCLLRLLCLPFWVTLTWMPVSEHAGKYEMDGMRAERTKTH